MSDGLSYRDAGVDIDAGDALVEAIKPFARKTMRPEVLAGIGGFGALCEIPKKYKQPVLVSGTDGVGTKLKLAFALHRHGTVGIDLVAMSANVVLGLASSGPHSNGYSLIRRIIGDEHLSSELTDSLMEPTRIYVKPVLKLAAAMPVKGLAHITGGGLVGNVPRVLPKGTRAVLDKKKWPRHEIFRWLQKNGNVAEEEMFRVFNCGLGMVIIVAQDKVQLATMLLKREGELAYEIGTIEAGGDEPEAVIT